MLSDEHLAILPAYLKDSDSLYLTITDLEGNYTYVNDFFARKFSYIYENFIGTPFSQSVYQGDVELCNQTACFCITNPTKNKTIDIRKPDKEGEDFVWTRWQFSAFLDKQGNILGILCIGSDVTERYKANTKLLDYAKKIDLVIDNITDGFFVLDNQFRFVRINPIVKHTLKASEHEILGKNIFDVVPQSIVVGCKEPFEEAIATNESAHFDLEAYEWGRWFSVNAYPSPTGLSVLFQDRTELIITLEKVRLQNEKFREITHLQSHKVRQPVASILGLLSLIKQEKMNKEVSELFLLLEISALKLDDVVHQIVKIATEEEMLSKKL
ncbi:MAG: PAS domain-containing protein [Bernardetiaceae bacterium]|nr:PAS domain-containing protein [Bernardetiaceae bacterium]